MYIVLDVSYSGSCVIAAANEGRNCVAVEEDPVLYIHSKVRVVDANGAIQKQQKSENVLEENDTTQSRTL